MSVCLIVSLHVYQLALIWKDVDPETKEVLDEDSLLAGFVYPMIASCALWCLSWPLPEWPAREIWIFFVQIW